MSLYFVSRVAERYYVAVSIRYREHAELPASEGFAIGCCKKSYAVCFSALFLTRRSSSARYQTTAILISSSTTFITVVCRKIS